MMRKSVFLTLLVALFCTAAAWAEFNPTPGVKYALQERTSGLYLDIQTMGITDPGLNTNNISLSSAPCAIYFEAYDEWTWKMKNVNGQYVSTANYAWNPEIGNSEQNWFIVEDDERETIKIHFWSSYIVGNTTVGTPLYCDRTALPLEFSLVDFVEQVQEYIFHVNVPQGENIIVKYGEDVVSDGRIFTDEFDVSLFTATDIEGYTWEIVVNRVNYTITLVYTKVVDGDEELNGYYHIYYTNGNSRIPLFIGYNTDNDSSGDDYTGYKILGESVYTTDAEADKIFAIMPQGDGYTIAAQGKSLLAPNFDGWNHVQFSDDNAGVYLFHETNLTGVFKIQGIGGDGLEDGVHNDYLQVYNVNGNLIVGPNPENSASSFTIISATSYTIAIPESGYLPLHLPFNVILPAGIEAYDINNLSENALVTGEGLLERIAGAGDIVQAGTPMILKGTAGSHTLEITMNNEGAKASLVGSVLRGNYVKKVLTISDDIKKFVLNGEVFEAIMGGLEIPANSCWIEADIEDDDIDLVPEFIEIGEWKFRVKESGKGIKITDCVEFGSGHLEIGPLYTVNGISKEVLAIADDFLHDYQDLTEVTLPYTLTSVGESHANYMFEITYSGPDNGKGQNIGVPAVGKDDVKEAEQWVGTPHACHYKVLGASTWRMTVDVNVDTEALDHFNEFGSCLFATKENTLSNNYNDGSMQLYLRSDRGIVLKLDQTGDTYMFNNPQNLVNLPDGTQYLGDVFTFILENDGAGGYMAQMVYGDGTVEAFEITAADHAELHDFNTIWSSLGEGIEVKVKFEKLTNRGLFVGCKNLTAIHVHEDNPSFSGCDHGVLYNKAKTHVIRFPEGGGHVEADCHFEQDGHRHFETPREVTMVYAGALHGVNAHIIFHSNPLIMHVDGHEDHMIAKYHLIIDDDENVVDFHTGNTNLYQTLKYKRAPLAEGKYGSIILPFVPDNALNKYDFFELLEGNAESLTFAYVEELEANIPYLYKLKDEIIEDIAVFEEDETIDVMTGVTTQIRNVGHNPSVSRDVWNTVGCYVSESVITNDENDEATYYGIDNRDMAFVRVNKKINAKPYRAYFVNTKGKTTFVSAPRLSLRMKNGDITEIDPSQVEGLFEPEYYDLMGRRVQKPTNGIYIVNGKKVLF